MHLKIITGFIVASFSVISYAGNWVYHEDKGVKLAVYETGRSDVREIALLQNVKNKSGKGSIYNIELLLNLSDEVECSISTNVYIKSLKNQESLVCVMYISDGSGKMWAETFYFKNSRDDGGSIYMSASNFGFIYNRVLVDKVLVNAMPLVIQVPIQGKGYQIIKIEDQVPFRKDYFLKMK